MATLTATITESCVLNGSNQGGSNTLSVAGINEITKRVVTCTASQTTTIANFGTTVHAAASNIDVEDTRYIRITNLDSSNSITVAMVGASDNFQVVVPGGHSLVFGTPDDFMLGEEDQSPAFASYEDLASIQVNPGGNAVSVELFVASV